jgi:hypothetical protein
MSAPNPPQAIEIPPGVLAVTTWGMVRAATTQALWDLRAFNDGQGIKNIHYTLVAGGLVDRARNESARGMLAGANPRREYLMFIDADMKFAPDAMARILHTAYGLCPWADVVGGYCQLRGKPYLPTIDTGTGTWESHDAGMGPVEVIRTGSACILIKRHVFERMEFPWYGVRHAARPIDMLAEVDNYARVKFDGQNPLLGDSWYRLEKCAREDAMEQRKNIASQQPGGTIASVGEDSNFCDRAKALNFRLVVQTDVVCHHLDEEVIGPEKHMDEQKLNERFTKLVVGVM